MNLLHFFAKLLPLAAWIVLCYPALAVAETFYVDASYGDDIHGKGTQEKPWRTISLALSKVHGKGHSIFVGPGIYAPVTRERPGEVFPLYIPPGVSLYGEGAEQTIIDANFENTAIVVEDSYDSMILEGFTIRNGFHHSNRPLTGADVGCIYINNANPIVRNNSIEGGIAPYGGSGILIEGHSSAKLLRNTFHSNLSEFTGGTVEMRGGSSILIDGNLFQENIVGKLNDEGAAIYIDSIATSTVTIYNNIIVDTGGNAIAVFDPWNRATIVNNTVVRSSGSAVLLSYSGKAVLRNNIFADSGRHGIEEINWMYLVDSDPLSTTHNLFAANHVSAYLDEGFHNYFTSEDLDKNIPDAEFNFQGVPSFADDGYRDFHIAMNSICLDAGTDVDAPLFDYDGEERKAPIDVGADEVSLERSTWFVRRSGGFTGQRLTYVPGLERPSGQKDHLRRTEMMTTRAPERSTEQTSRENSHPAQGNRGKVGTEPKVRTTDRVASLPTASREQSSQRSRQGLKAPPPATARSAQKTSQARSESPEVQSRNVATKVPREETSLTQAKTPGSDATTAQEIATGEEGEATLTVSTPKTTLTHPSRREQSVAKVTASQEGKPETIATGKGETEKIEAGKTTGTLPSIPGTKADELAKAAATVAAAGVASVSSGESRTEEEKGTSSEARTSDEEDKASADGTQDVTTEKTSEVAESGKSGGTAEGQDGAEPPTPEVSSADSTSAEPLEAESPGAAAIAAYLASRSKPGLRKFNIPDFEMPILSIDASSRTVYSGETVSLMVESSTDFDSDYLWSSSNRRVLRIEEPRGPITTARAIRTGRASAIVTGTDSKATDSTRINVLPPTVYVKLNKDVIYIGDTATAEARTMKDLDDSYRWISSPAQVATITSPPSRSVEVLGGGVGLTAITAIGSSSQAHGFASLIVISSDDDIVLVAPRDRESLSAECLPTFSWFSRNARPLKIEIATSRAFREADILISSEVTKLSYPLELAEWQAIERLTTDGGPLYWRVIDPANAKTVSEIRSFSSAPFCPPQDVSIVALSDSEISINWRNPKRYDSIHPCWNAEDVRTPRGSVSRIATNFIDDELLPETPLQYQVVAYRDGQWSGSRIVDVKTLSRTYQAPVLIEPPDQSRNLPMGDLFLNWEPRGPDSKHYFLEVFDASRTAMIWRLTDETNFTIPADELSYSSVYYWRVWANDAFKSAWITETTSSFTIAPKGKEEGGDQPSE